MFTTLKPFSTHLSNPIAFLLYSLTLSCSIFADFYQIFYFHKEKVID
jgi:hypothetical protein